MERGGILHKGIIVTIDGSRAKVKILDASAEACSCCSAASFCGGASTTVDVVLSPEQALTARKGDKVTLSAPSGIGTKATTRLLVIPLATFIIALVVALQLGATELWACVAAFIAVAAVYAAVYLLGRRNDQTWSILKLTK